jgi:hypothetical protein
LAIKLTRAWKAENPDGESCPDLIFPLDMCPSEYLLMMYNLLEKHLEAHPEEAQHVDRDGLLPIHSVLVCNDALMADESELPVSTIKAIIDTYLEGLLTPGPQLGLIPIACAAANVVAQERNIPSGASLKCRCSTYAVQ